MELNERLDLITRNAEEVITLEELEEVLLSKETVRAYVGFEPSGLMHIGLGMVLSAKLRDFVEAGLKTIVLLADWHAYINDKFNGDLEKIGICAEYLKDCFRAMNVPEDVEYIYASELVNRKEYWQKVLQVSKSSSVARIKRAMTIMGRREEEAELDASKLIYPAMQVADIQELDLDISLGGMDQRHAHMLLRDIAPKLGWRKVVAVHTPILPGLKGGGRMDSYDQKMSKSDPGSCIFIHDEPEQIRSKIDKAFCPPEEEGNPILGIWKHILFPRLGKALVQREERFGGDLEFSSYDELVSTYTSGKLHAADLKRATAEVLADVLQPVRQYFENHPENLEQVSKAVLK